MSQELSPEIYRQQANRERERALRAIKVAGVSALALVIEQVTLGSIEHILNNKLDIESGIFLGTGVVLSTATFLWSQHIRNAVELRNRFFDFPPHSADTL